MEVGLAGQGGGNRNHGSKRWAEEKADDKCSLLSSTTRGNSVFIHVWLPPPRPGPPGLPSNHPDQTPNHPDQTPQRPVSRSNPNKTLNPLKSQVFQTRMLALSTRTRYQTWRAPKNATAMITA